MPRYPRALALGLLGPPPRAASGGRVEARVALALLAARRGYALLETVETTGTPQDLTIALGLVENLALRLDVDALATRWGTYTDTGPARTDPDPADTHHVTWFEIAHSETDPGVLRRVLDGLRQL